MDCITASPQFPQQLWWSQQSKAVVGKPVKVLLKYSLWAQLTVMPNKSSHTKGHLGFLLCFLLKLFIILHFTFRSMIHFRLIFMKGERSLSRFIFFCMWMSSCSSTIYGRDYFAQLYCLCSYSKDQLTIWGSISGLSSLFHLSIFLFFSFIHQYHTVLITAAL